MRNMVGIFIDSMRQYCGDKVVGYPIDGAPCCASNEGTFNGTAGPIQDGTGASGGEKRSGVYANDNRRTYFYRANV